MLPEIPPSHPRGGQAYIRLAYLQSASETLSSTAPATSAFLGSEIHRIGRLENASLVDDPKESRASGLDTVNCGACGALFRSDPGGAQAASGKGLGSKRSARRRRRKSGNEPSDRGSNDRPVETKRVLVCGRCGRKTQTPRPSDKGGHKRDTDNRTLSTLVQTAEAPAQDPVSNVKSSGRSRAKARRQSGLMSMLGKKTADAESKAETHASGLDLMDFMRPG